MAERAAGGPTPTTSPPGLPVGYGSVRSLLLFKLLSKDLGKNSGGSHVCAGGLGTNK